MALAGQGHRRQPVLHHALTAAAPRRALHGLRSRGERDGGGGSDCAVGISCGACGSGTGSPHRSNPVPVGCLKAAVTASSRPSSSRPLLSSPSESPPSRGVIREVFAAASGALCRLARRAGCRRSRFVGRSRRSWTRDGACVSSGAQQLGACESGDKKNGVPSDEHPVKPCRRTTASSRPSSSRPWQPSSPLCSP